MSTEFISVTPYITERLSTTKVAWLYSQPSTLKRINALLLEEICVLGVLLMFGEGSNRLYTSLTPYRTANNEEIYCVSLRRCDVVEFFLFDLKL